MGASGTRPSVLIDECMPRSFAEFFSAIGFTVYVVGDLLPSGSPDASVLAAELNVDAIVVTIDADFRNLKKSASGYGGQLARADRIYFRKCSHVKARERIAELIDVIEREYSIAKERRRKFSFQITPESFTVFR